MRSQALMCNMDVNPSRATDGEPEAVFGEFLPVTSARRMSALRL
jgi:hypothetical protein